jgi:hypothetical protein
MAAGAALSLSGQARAAAAPKDRKFLFFFAGGGWDTTTVLDPHFSGTVIDMDPETEMAEQGSLTWTTGPDRENVDRYFSRWGGHTAIVNGINNHSVGHDAAAQFVMTGTSASSFADWPTILAANSKTEYPLPHLVFSGPAYPGTYGSAVVRAGGGTLLELIDGSINGRADQAAPVLPTPADEMLDAFVRQRVANFAAKQDGNGRVRADSLTTNVERAMELEGRRFEAGLNDLGRDVLDQAMRAVELMRLGLSRCAMIRIPGGWDTHGNIMPQATQQDAFYGVLDEIFDYMARTPGDAATWLIDEVVIVATSEIGRTPSLNGGGGKDHWPYGSTLVAGAGVNGNRVLGGTDESLIAVPVDFASGETSDAGESLGCENVGTALLALGGLDPEEFLPGVPALTSLLRSA